MSDQSKFLGYRSGHSMGFGCAGIEEDAARLRRDLSEALEVLRELAMDVDMSCPSCRDVFGEHAPDCRLAALLAKYPR